jgi:TRAP-type C4-dicarboxylate transport system permease small subunit
MKKAYALLCAVEAVLAGLFLLAMVILIFAGGIARLAHHPLNWTIDIATCLFAWACFLAADIAWRNGNLMSVEILTERLPVAAQRFLITVNYVLIALFLVFLIISGVWLAYVSSTRSFQGIPGISYSWITASLPAGAAMLLLTTLVKLAQHRRLAAPSSVDQGI